MKNNNIFVCTALICSISIIDANQSNSLFEDIKKGKVEAVKRRFDNGENLSIKDAEGKNALHIAAQAEDEEGNEQAKEEIIELLTTEQGWWDWTCSWFVSVATLPNKDEQDNEGNTPLHYAFKEKNARCAKKLLDKGVKRSIQNTKKLPPVFMIMEKSHVHTITEKKLEATISLCNQYKLFDQTLDDGSTVLHYCATKNEKDIADDTIKVIKNIIAFVALDNKFNDNGETPVMVAAKLGYIQWLDAFKKSGINLHNRGKNGKAPIHSATEHNCYDAVKFLLEHSDSADLTDNQQNTPLHYASHFNRPEIAKLLIAYKANVNQFNNAQKTPLTIATKRKHYNVIRYLAQVPGVKIDDIDNQGRTPFLYAALDGDLSGMQQLYDAGANIAHKDHDQENALHKIARNGLVQPIDFLLKRSKSLASEKNIHGDIPVAIAIANGNEEATRELFKYTPFSLSIKNNIGETLIHQVAKTNNPALLNEILNKVNVRDINTKDNQGRTPLDIAITYNNVLGMQELEKYGAGYSAHAAHIAIDANALNALIHIKKVQPHCIKFADNNGNTPFVRAGAIANVAIIKELFNDTVYGSGELQKAIEGAYAYKNNDVYNFLKEKKDERLRKCTTIGREYNKGQNLLQEKEDKIQFLITKNYWHVITAVAYQSPNLDYYSPEQLYCMSDANLDAIHNYYLQYNNKELNNIIILDRELNNISSQEQAEKERQKRIERERLQKEKEKKRREEARLAEERELAHAQELKRQRDAFAAQKAAEEAGAREQKEKEEAIAAVERQKERDRIAAAKALADQQKHKQALEGQHPYTPNFTPSAPPMDDDANVPTQGNNQEQQKQCEVCKKNALSKAIPCKKCKKMVPNVCASCFNKYGAVCPDCVGKDVLKIPKEKQRECCILGNNCTDLTEGVTIIPCKNCKKYTSSDRICKTCLEEWITDKTKEGKPHRCPRCLKDDGLDDVLLQKVKNAYN